MPRAQVMDSPDSKKLFMVMEYVSRGAVMKTAQQHGLTPLDMPTCRRYLRDVLCGLEYLHLNGIMVWPSAVLAMPQLATSAALDAHTALGLGCSTHSPE